MVSLTKLEKLTNKELEKENKLTFSKIKTLKDIILNYDEKLKKINKLSNEAFDLGKKFKSVHQNELKADYNEESKFFEKNKGMLDYYFTSAQKEIKL